MVYQDAGGTIRKSQVGNPEPRHAARPAGFALGCIRGFATAADDGHFVFPRHRGQETLHPRCWHIDHDFGSIERPEAVKMRQATQMIKERAPTLEVEGEMHGDTALSDEIRQKVFPHSRLRGEANLLVMPTLDAANISFNLLKVASAENVTIGPILLGAARPVHILTPSATVRRIVNMTALIVADANAPRGQEQTLF